MEVSLITLYTSIQYSKGKTQYLIKILLQQKFCKSFLQQNGELSGRIIDYLFVSIRNEMFFSLLDPGLATDNSSYNSIGRLHLTKRQCSSYCIVQTIKSCESVDQYRSLKWKLFNFRRGCRHANLQSVEVVSIRPTSV